jgi:DNA polymerase family A/3'-5' exonuclease
MNVILANWTCPFLPWRPADGQIFERFSYDAETTLIDNDRPALTPSYVIGAACDGNRGVFITREHVSAFFRAHQRASFICHNASFDLRVTHALLHPQQDIYEAVEENRVWDTLILHRLLTLATEGHTARGGSSLDDCATRYLGVALQKGQVDDKGKPVRLSFGQFLGKPPSSIPSQHLTYLAQDTIATWHVFQKLNSLIRDVLRNADRVWGYVDDDWLRDVVRRYGPLTHHIQLRASILTDVLSANGIGIDRNRSVEKATQVQRVMEECRGRLNQRGYLPNEKGCNKALQHILNTFQHQHREVPMRRTESGKAWSTTEEDLAELAAEDTFFRDLRDFRTAEKLLSTYLRKMRQSRLHARFGYLLETGRTCCGGGFNLQNLPKEKDVGDVASTIRGCFTPAEGKVYLDADYSQAELVVLGYALREQFRFGSTLASLINSGEDVHRLIAAGVLGKSAHEIGKDERNSAKPVSFGRPGGMGAERLRRIAKAGYGLDLTVEDVEQRIQAYHTLCPELDRFLQDELDTGLVVATALGLTPADYGASLGLWVPNDSESRSPAGWLGGMLLKVLCTANPVTQMGQGRPYSQEEIDYFWDKAARLPVELSSELAASLRAREASPALAAAVRNWAGRRSVFTFTGRLRANATFCSSRNCIFQGPAADGAILGMWNVWRAGYHLVDFVHDQVVAEVPADSRVGERRQEVEQLLVAGMHSVMPGMRIKVETMVTLSLNKNDLDPRYAETETLHV